MKYITVKLTEDQAYSVLNELETIVHDLDDYLDLDGTAEAQKAFYKRIIVKLAQSIVTEQAKS